MDVPESKASAPEVQTPKPSPPLPPGLAPAETDGQRQQQEEIQAHRGDGDEALAATETHDQRQQQEDVQAHHSEEALAATETHDQRQQQEEVQAHRGDGEGANSSSMGPATAEQHGL